MQNLSAQGQAGICASLFGNTAVERRRRRGTLWYNSWSVLEILSQQYHLVLRNTGMPGEQQMLLFTSTCYIYLYSFITTARPLLRPISHEKIFLSLKKQGQPVTKVLHTFLFVLKKWLPSAINFC